MKKALRGDVNVKSLYTAVMNCAGDTLGDGKTENGIGFSVDQGEVSVDWVMDDLWQLRIRFHTEEGMNCFQILAGLFAASDGSNDVTVMTSQDPLCKQWEEQSLHDALKKMVGAIGKSWPYAPAGNVIQYS